MAHQRAAHRQHLLLAAGQRAGLLVTAFLQTGEQAVDHVEVLLEVRLVLQAERAHLQVLFDAHACEDVAPFRNVRHTEGHDLVVVGFQQIHSVVHHGTGFRRYQTGDGVQRGGLACAVRADQGHDLAVVDGEADVLDGFDGTVRNGKVLDFQHQASSLSCLASSLSVSSSEPRYAEMTCGLLAISSGVPAAMVRP